MIKNYQLGLLATKRLAGRKLKELASLLTQTNPSPGEPSLRFPSLSVAGLSDALLHLRLASGSKRRLAADLAATPAPASTHACFEGSETSPLNLIPGRRH